MFNEYEEFLTKKAYKIENVGFDTDDVHPMLFPFQQAVVKWAAKKGRAAIFAVPAKWTRRNPPEWF